MLDLIKQLIQIPSITDSLEEVKPLAVIRAVLDKEGIGYKIIGRGTKLNLVAQIGKGKTSVLLTSHFDVVPTKEEMFAPKEMNGKLYGRGSADAKGALVAMLTAFLKLNKRLPDGKVIFCAVCDEENAGEKGTQVLVKEGFIGDHNIAGEPTNLNIVIAEKGFLRLSISIKGKERHAAFPKSSDNAIYIASEVIKELQDMRLGTSHPLLDSSTISFGTIRGGNKINIGAGSCEIGVDIRYVPSLSENDILKQIKKTLDSFCDYSISIIGRGLPFETQPSSPLVKIAKSVTHGKLQGVNFGTDARFYFPKDTIVIGPGKSEIAHQEKEFVDIHQLEKAAIYYEKIVRGCLVRQEV